MKANLDVCRVCGYLTEEPPWGHDGRHPTFDYCPCCGVEWGYQDVSEAGTQRFRASWLAAGATWNDPAVPDDGLTTAERLSRVANGIDL